MKSHKNQVLKDIQKLGNNVTVADVVARSGCSLQESSLLLTEIASETAATLHVNADGQITYRFRPNFQYIYLSKGTARIIAKVTKTVVPAALFLFKISFGLTLMVSVIVIFGVILVIRSLLSVGIDQGESVPAMWVDFFSAFKGIVWFDFRRSRDRKAAALARDSGSVSNAVAEPVSTQGFLLDCYDFLFGPGNPNEGLEEERWKLIAQTIRLNEGIVLAEHFVPYTGRPPEDEQALFAILAKFNGQPTVSEAGDILYVFPSISVRSEVANYAFTAPLVQEREWQFTGLTKQALRPVIMLAVANLFGALLFLFLIYKVGGKHTSDLRLFAFFSLYGCLFLAIPLVRWFGLQSTNQKIRHSNQVAREYEEKLGKPDLVLRRKLEDAEQIRRTESTMQNSQIVYRTDQDYLEQLTDASSQKN